MTAGMTMGDERAGPKMRRFELQSRVCAALYHPARLRIIFLVGEGERAASELAGAIGLSDSGMSRHLRALRAANLVSVRRRWARVWCALTHPKVLRACEMLRDVAAEQLLAECRQAGLSAAAPHASSRVPPGTAR